MSPITKKEKNYWRSFEQIEGSSQYKKYLYREFQEGAAFLEEGVSRRSFLKIMGASAALAGVSGCNIRRPKQHIRPYAQMPEFVVPGKATYYATAYQQGEDVSGVLVESYEGRPTKIEGNPRHRYSLGATTVFQQASVLSLYDPDRIKHSYKRVSGDKVAVLNHDFSDDISQRILEQKGRKVAVLTTQQVSSTFMRLASKLRKKYASIQFFQYDPINRDNQLQGIFKVTGEYFSPELQLKSANIIASFGSDFMGSEPGQVANTKSFSSRRDPESGDMNRLYVFESRYSVTGTKADHRVRATYDEVERSLVYVANELVKKGVISGKTLSLLLGSVPKAKHLKEDVLQALLDDLLHNKGKSVVVVGAQQSEISHGLAYIINRALANAGKTVVYRSLNFSNYSFVTQAHLDSIESLTHQLRNGNVDTLVILGGNPAYNAPSNLKFGEALKAVDRVYCLTDLENETSELSNVVIPRSHYLESWSDLKALDGSESIVQPTVSRLYDSFTDSELVSLMIGEKKSDYTLVRETWREQTGGANFESNWKKWLHDGLVVSAQKGSDGVPYVDHGFQKSFRSYLDQNVSTSLSVVFYPDYSLYDGRFNNNGWLQECPDPITKLTWDNAALMSKATAKSLQLQSEDLVRISSGDYVVEIPIMILPGHADHTISLFYGYGRQLTGRVGVASGFDVFPLKTTQSIDVVRDVTVINTKKKYSLATTQNHGSMEGRPLYRETTKTDYKEHPDKIKSMVETPPLNSLFEERPYDTGYQWGMAIDLSKCTGCNACVVGCQSENNIPIVGKKEVLNGREMHWIRVDRYFEGDEDEVKVVEQPVTCLQCENAPCEQVCPVAATTHSEEGLNDMTYNRCVGTRYCSDNCPAKVRRFNFFDYHQRNPQSKPKDRNHLFDYMREPEQSVQMQFNPDVTVRMRGVMEKCTFCIQRISSAKKKAKNNQSIVKDGDIMTACEQACPADAIVFGNIRDPKSKVSILKSYDREYHILEQLHLKPRTTYLASILNPNPSLEPSEMKEGAHHG